MNTIKAAKKLIGNYLVHETPNGTLKGKIIETEAYLQNDPASHTYNGPTKRNKTMYKGPGHAYVYFTYGMHHCINLTTKPGEAILIRALEPIEGIELMKKHRKTNDLRNLCSGPAKITQALQITQKYDGLNLTNSKLRIELGTTPKQITTTTRIGITKAKDSPYRFYETNNEYVSRK